MAHTHRTGREVKHNMVYIRVHTSVCGCMELKGTHTHTHEFPVSQFQTLVNGAKRTQWRQGFGQFPFLLVTVWCDILALQIDPSPHFKVVGLDWEVTMCNTSCAQHVWPDNPRHQKPKRAVSNVYLYSASVRGKQQDPERQFGLSATCHSKEPRGCGERCYPSWLHQHARTKGQKASAGGTSSSWAKPDSTYMYIKCAAENRCFCVSEYLVSSILFHAML